MFYHNNAMHVTLKIAIKCHTCSITRFNITSLGFEKIYNKNDKLTEGSVIKMDV
jgi:nitrate reductase beta subunit